MYLDQSRPSPVLTLQEVSAPQGWTAALLQQQLPIDDDEQLLAYRDAVAKLMERLTPFSEVHAEEVFLQFGRCRPDREIKLLQANARLWMPEFGVGIWLHGDPPHTWTRDEFEEAEPGTLRPVIERVVRVQRDPRRTAVVMADAAGFRCPVTGQCRGKGCLCHGGDRGVAPDHF